MKILIIIPCFNEEFRLKTDLFSQFSHNNPSIHFLFVDDGSTDNTIGLLKSLCSYSDNLNYKTLNKNKGKAEAIRHGVLSSKKEINDYDFIGYFDADLSVPLNEIHNFIEMLNKYNDTKFILGIRIARLGAKIKRNFFRHYFGRIFATFVSVLLKEPVYDSQCGAKLIHSSIILKLFEYPFISKWFFDIELIYRYKLFYPMHMNKILEFPISQWNEIPDSKLKFKNYIMAPFKLIKIWLKYRK